MTPQTLSKNANPATDLKARIGSIIAARETGVLLALLVICVFLTFATSSFLTVRNLLNVGRQISLLGIMAIGMTFVLVSREVDLSVGSTYAISGLVTGMLIVRGSALIPALSAGLLVGMVIGAMNGVLSTYGKLPSFIATLGMLSVVRGAALLITDGQPVTVDTTRGGRSEVVDQFYQLGQGQLFGIIPMLLVCFLIVAAISWIVLAKTTFGFRVYAVGGSEKAARLSGIQVFQTKILTFTLMGLLSAIAGILSLAFLPSGQAGRTGVGLELDVIAAAIVGGRFAFRWRGHHPWNNFWHADHWDSEERACSAQYLSILANHCDRTRDYLCGRH